jgi:hypothetical protein
LIFWSSWSIYFNFTCIRYCKSSYCKIC